MIGSEIIPHSATHKIIVLQDPALSKDMKAWDRCYWLVYYGVQGFLKKIKEDSKEVKKETLKKKVKKSKPKLFDTQLPGHKRSYHKNLDDPSIANPDLIIPDRAVVLTMLNIRNLALSPPQQAHVDIPRFLSSKQIIEVEIRESVFISLSSSFDFHFNHKNLFLSPPQYADVDIEDIDTSRWQIIKQLNSTIVEKSIFVPPKVPLIIFPRMNGGLALSPPQETNIDVLDEHIPESKERREPNEIEIQESVLYALEMSDDHFPSATKTLGLSSPQLTDIDVTDKLTHQSQESKEIHEKEIQKPVLYIPISSPETQCHSAFCFDIFPDVNIDIYDNMNKGTKFKEKIIDYDIQTTTIHHTVSKDQNEGTLVRIGNFIQIFPSEQFIDDECNKQINILKKIFLLENLEINNQFTQPLYIHIPNSAKDCQFSPPKLYLDPPMLIQDFPNVKDIVNFPPNIRPKHKINVQPSSISIFRPKYPQTFRSKILFSLDPPQSPDFYKTPSVRRGDLFDQVRVSRRTSFPLEHINIVYRKFSSA